MATVYINDHAVDIGDRRLNCVQAARMIDLLIPHYCYHDALSVVASCRMCLVEVGELKDGKVMMMPKVVPGCQTPVKDGTVIVTGDYDKWASRPGHEKLPYDERYRPGEKAQKSQADTLEGLLLNHPLDCPVCDKAGECKLQDYSYQFGRSESRLVDEKNQPPNKPELSSTITLFTDRCIMCTRCVRFTREISGTSELQVVGRGHHEEIDVFPGFPLENKLAGNVVDLCPVGALGSKDFLYKQRVWYLNTTSSVCSGCSTGCSTYVDSNKEIVYRLRARENLEAQGYFICDEGRYGYHFNNAPSRLRVPRLKTTSQRQNWQTLLPVITSKIQDLLQQESVVVFSPFLTLEEAYYWSSVAREINPKIDLALGPVPVKGEDDHYPKNRQGLPLEPTKFTIRAEKCPNRRGIEKILKHYQSEIHSFADVTARSWQGMLFLGGYSDPSFVDAALPVRWQAPENLWVIDLFESALSREAVGVLPATSPFEKEGIYVNHAGYAQPLKRAVKPPREVRSELQLAHDLAGRTGLVSVSWVRAQGAKLFPELARYQEDSSSVTTKKELAIL